MHQNRLKIERSQSLRKKQVHLSKKLIANLSYMSELQKSRYIRHLIFLFEEMSINN